MLCLIVTSPTTKIDTEKGSITNLPFGNPLLVKHKFPKGGWNVPLDDSTIGKSVSIHTDALNKVGSFYIKLGEDKSIKGPVIKQLHYLIMGDDSRLIAYERKFQADFKCQLPDFGPYKCYYQDYQVPMAYYYELEDKSDGSEKLYFEYGNLVFYNPQNEQAKVLNVYNSYSYKEPTGGGNRYFFVDVKKTITIYDAWQGESHDIIKKAQEVKIQNDGQIVISNVK